MRQSSVVQTHWRPRFSVALYRPSIMGWIHDVWIWLSRRHVYQDLSSLDDYLLDDVGISREALRRLRKPPWWA